MKAALCHLSFIAILAIAFAATGLAQSSPLVITSPDTLPQGSVGASYNFQFQATGGSPPYTWSKGSPFGGPPQGLFLGSDGALLGTPSTAGQFSFPVRVTDSQGQATTKIFGLTIVQGQNLFIATSSPLPAGVPGEQYQVTLLATGGTAPFIWDLNGGTLPQGYLLDPRKGEISGVTQQQGVFQFQVIVVDSQQRTAVKNFVLSVGAGGLTIAPDPPLPTAFVGQTYSASLSVVGVQTFFSWFIIGGALPPGLDLSIETGEITGIPVEPGTFVWTVLARNIDGLSAVREYSVRVDGNPDEEPQIDVSLLPLSFSFASGGPPGIKGLRIRNRGGGAVPVSVQASTLTGGSWLSLIPSEGVVSAAEPLDVLVRADSGQIGPGSYSGRVSVTGADLPTDDFQFQTAATLALPASMTISTRRQFLRLSLDGLTFTAVKGGGAPPPLSFDIINEGSDPMPFSTQAIVSEAGWLQAGPAQGVVNRNGRIPVTVQVNQQGLDPGVYFALFEVRASQAAGEVRLLTIVLNVLPAGSQPPLVVDPLGLLFVASAGGPDPPGRAVVISNLGATPVTFTSNIFAEGPQNSFSYAPQQGQVLPNQPATIGIRPTISGLPEGVYRSQILLEFDDGTTQTLTPVVIVGPAGGATLSKSTAAINGCPTKLDIAISSFSAGYPSYVDAPAFLRAEVADDCGQLLLEGEGRSVRAEAAGQTAFLSPRGEGVWEATFDFQVSGMQTVEVTAQDVLRGLAGHATIAGGVQPPLAERPKIDPGGVIHGASFRPAPLAPGSMISIFGQNQSNSTSPTGEPATSLPLPDLLAGTRVRAGGVFLPLFFSLQRQVNAGFPHNFNANAGPLSIVVFRGSVPSDPEEVALTGGHPGLFTINGSGAGEGIFQDISFRLISSSLPPAANPGGRTGISPGEPVIIYATGLGAVTNAPSSGQPASDNPLSHVTAGVQLTIGGQNAPVVFKGLTPDLVSLYQINATVPEGLPPGDAEVIVTVDGVSSPAGVTLSIE